MRGSKSIVTAGLLVALGASGAFADEYRVRRGDSLAAIAQRFDTTVGALERTNGLTSNVIHPGQVLTVPSTGPRRHHSVRRGDTLGGLAVRYGVTIHALKVANDLSGDVIRVGQRLVIPGGDESSRPRLGGSPVDEPEPSPSPSDRSRDEREVLFHEVRPGDTLTELARRYGTTVEDIKHVNRLRSSTIRIGERLTIPRESALPTPEVSEHYPDGTPVHERMSASRSELEVLARIVKGECPRSVPPEGRVAVAAVVLNRVRSDRFPDSIRAVAHQPRQFSCYNRDVRDRLYWGRVPESAWDAAREALAGVDPSYGSTYYYNPYLVQPGWARRLDFVRRIGDSSLNTHDFYRVPGVEPPTRPRSGGPAPAAGSGLTGRLDDLR